MGSCTISLSIRKWNIPSCGPWLEEHCVEGGLCFDAQDPFPACHDWWWKVYYRKLNNLKKKETSNKILFIVTAQSYQEIWSLCKENRIFLANDKYGPWKMTKSKKILILKEITLQSGGKDSWHCTRVFIWAGPTSTQLWVLDFGPCAESKALGSSGLMFKDI